MKWKQVWSAIVWEPVSWETQNTAQLLELLWSFVQDQDLFLPWSSGKVPLTTNQAWLCWDGEINFIHHYFHLVLLLIISNDISCLGPLWLFPEVPPQFQNEVRWLSALCTRFQHERSHGEVSQFWCRTRYRQESWASVLVLATNFLASGQMINLMMTLHFDPWWLKSLNNDQRWDHLVELWIWSHFWY